MLPPTDKFPENEQLGRPQYHRLDARLDGSIDNKGKRVSVRKNL